MTLAPAYGPAPAQGGLDFSTTEQDTGLKFTGGETIYQKTITFSAGPNNSTVNTAHGITNLGKILSVEGFMDDGTIQRNINNIETSAGTAIQAQWAISDTNFIHLSGLAGDFSGYSGIVTLRYTKTA